MTMLSRLVHAARRARASQGGLLIGARCLAGQAPAGIEWEILKKEGHDINPCNSHLHPAVRAGIEPESEEVLSVQEAYTPDSVCWGCGESCWVLTVASFS